MSNSNKGILAIYPFPGPIPSAAPFVPHATSAYSLQNTSYPKMIENST